MSKQKSQRKLENILNRMKIKTHQKFLNAAKAMLRKKFTEKKYSDYKRKS